MNLVIDANVFVAFYQESVLNIVTTSLTKSPMQIFDSLDEDIICYFDENGFIKTEWSNLVEPEWFNIWYADRLLEGSFFIIPIKSNITNLKKALNNLGFPKSNDIWYIKVCKEVRNICDSVFLVTEDMDFYDPKKKMVNSKVRNKIINSSNGNVAKLLKKKENIFVRSVSSYIDENI